MAVISAGGALLPYQDQELKGNLTVDGNVTVKGKITQTGAGGDTLISPTISGTVAGGATYTAPTFTAPVLGVATATSVAATGAVSSSGTAGIGYATGAGGTIAQASSRTTGVTLSKISGQITLVSAAGSATPATFTVTNTLVAATDVVIVNQASGTDLYEIFVTAVGAGSFKITSFTTGGTTTETPVFNFVVIKGVAA
jgi:hypothetical protein